MEKVFCLLGPTASGKTRLALQLAGEYPVDIISVDSAMVYRGMDIGTAKPTADEQRLAPHRLIDICDPKEGYSAGQFCTDALREIHLTLKNKRIPLLVGGTMLYFNLLQRGFTEFPGADLSVRAVLEKEAAQRGWDALHQELSRVDPESARRINPNDKQRISRALELYRSLGKTRSALQHEQAWQTWPFEFVTLIIEPLDRAVLHARIEQRLAGMFQQGFVEEVKGLFERGDLSAELPSMRMVGYRQVWSYLAGEYNFEQAQARALFATRQLAKRQLTWLRSWPAAIRLDSESRGLYKNLQYFFEE